MSRGCESAKQASDLQLRSSSFATGVYSLRPSVIFFHFEKLLHTDSTIFVLSQANISTSALFRISAQSAFAMC
jgi:hypothetical protein